MTHSALLDTQAAADVLGLSPNTLSRWRWSGSGPRFVKLGRAVRYRREDLDQFIAQAARESTSDSGPGSAPRAVAAH